MAVDLRGPFLDAMRQEGDPLADGLARTLFESQNFPPELARRGYNHLLNLCDRLRDSPELYLLEDSVLRREFDLYPEGLRDFFDPCPLPAWVEQHLLERASRVWTSNSVAVLLVLCTASLPHCYGIKNGIPLLYDTAKLRDPKFLSQRIHETGIMLKEVMDPGGFRIILDKGGDLASRMLVRDVLRESRMVTPEMRERVRAVGARIDQAGLDGERYLWGRGYLAARKVRMLHASMRYMVMNPSRVQAIIDEEKLRRPADGLSRLRDPWPAATFGVPVNQEDLAFTLQTFGHVIAGGLKHWGVRLDEEDHRAFLHLWRLVGHVMGIRDELLTDDPDEARALFEAIAARQAGASESGRRLTGALMDVGGHYLPTAFGLGRALPPVLVLDQVGAEVADMVLPEEDRRRARNPILRGGWAVVRTGLRVYYRLRHIVFERFSGLQDMVLGTFHRGAEAVVESWRSEVTRRTFDIPAADDSDWEAVRGADAAYLAALDHWRVRVFRTLAAAVVVFVVAVMAFPLALLTSAAPWSDRVENSILLLAGGVAASWILVRVLMERLLKRRPVPVVWNPTRVFSCLQEPSAAVGAPIEALGVGAGMAAGAASLATVPPGPAPLTGDAPHAG